MHGIKPGFPLCSYQTVQLYAIAFLTAWDVIISQGNFSPVCVVGGGGGFGGMGRALKYSIFVLGVSPLFCFIRLIVKMLYTHKWICTAENNFFDQGIRHLCTYKEWSIKVDVNALTCSSSDDFH